METSKQFALNLIDWGKGVVVAAGAAVVPIIYSAAVAAGTSGHFSVNWNMVGMAALAAGLSYLNKNFFTKGAIVTPNE